MKRWAWRCIEAMAWRASASSWVSTDAPPISRRRAAAIHQVCSCPQAALCGSHSARVLSSASSSSSAPGCRLPPSQGTS